MSTRVILSLCTRALSNGTGGGCNGSVCVIGLSRVHLPSTVLHGTPTRQDNNSTESKVTRVAFNYKKVPIASGD